MSGINDGGPAFPCMPPQDTVAGAATGYPYPDAGMTLRDYFAAKALAGMLADTNRSGAFEAFARDAYGFADAMLKARAAAPEGERNA